jgi:hypothetical protein
MARIIDLKEENKIGTIPAVVKKQNKTTLQARGFL